jgi:hypothetical protein
MAVFALLSAGGSPGVTTAGLALTLSWPSRVVLAECDPSGGDVLAGLLAGHLPASNGLLPLALEAGAGSEVPADTLWRQLIELDEEHNRLLLAGISDPRQSAALQSSLPWIADALQAMQADVVADCGRLDAVAAVRPVLAAASLAVLVLRPTLRQVSRAVPRIEMLTNLVGKDRVVALLVGDGTASGREVAKTLGVPVAGQLPDDGKTAAVLSDGLGSRRSLDSRPLIRAAAAAGRGRGPAAAAAGPLHGYGEQTVFTPYDSGQPGLDQYEGSRDSLAGYGPGQPRLDQYGSSQPGLSLPGLDQPGSSQSGPDQYDGSRGLGGYDSGRVGQHGYDSSPPVLGWPGLGRPGPADDGPPWDEPWDSPLHDSPLHDSPLHDSPLHDSPLHDSPLHDSPLHDGPLHDSPGRDGPVHDSRAQDGPAQPGLRPFGLHRREGFEPDAPYGNAQNGSRP